MPGTAELAENSVKTILQALTELDVATITFPIAEIATSSGSKTLPETKAEMSLEEKCCDQLPASFKVFTGTIAGYARLASAYMMQAVGWAAVPTVFKVRTGFLTSLRTLLALSRCVRVVDLEEGRQQNAPVPF